MKFRDIPSRLLVTLLFYIGVFETAYAVQTIYLTADDAHISNVLSNNSTSTPYYAGEPERYTSLLLSKNSDTDFVYEDGVYETYGYHYGEDGVDRRITAGTNCRHLGKGTNTIIRLVDSGGHGTSDGIIFANVPWEFATDGFELRDLMLDCNGQNQPKITFGQPKWVVLDLGASYSVDRVELTWGNHFSKLYDIEVATSTASWGAPVFSTMTGDGGTDNVIFNSKNGRYVRFHAPQLSGTNDLYQLKEFKVYSGGSLLAASNATDERGHNASSAIDGNLNTFWESTTMGQVSAVQISGSGIVISNVTVIGFATRTAKECFPITVGTAALAPQTVYSNNVIENVTITDPAPGNTDGLTCISMGAFKGYIEGPAGVFTMVAHTLTNSYVANCKVVKVREHFTYSNGFSVQSLKNSYVEDCNTGFYHEPHPAYGVNLDPGCRIEGCTFTNVNAALVFQCVTPPLTNKFIGDIYFASNTVYLSANSHAIWLHWTGYSGTNIFSSFVAEHNVIRTNSSNLSTNDFGFVFSRYSHGIITNILIRNNIIDIPNKDRVFKIEQNPAKFVSIYDNRDSSTNLHSVNHQWFDDHPKIGTQQQFDFTWDSWPDIVWRDQVTGSNLVWFMQGTNLIGSNYLSSTLLPSSWTPGAVGDFSGDVNTDLIWRRPDLDSILFWGLNRTNRVDVQFLDEADAEWQLSGAGDFNRDGKKDLVFRNSDGTNNVLMLMNGTNWLETVALPTRSGADLVIAGVGDFNKDLHTDILWRDYATGLQDIWLMNTTNYVSTVPLQPAIYRGSDEKVVLVADFTGEGDPDILWRNYSTGALSLWQLTQTNVVERSLSHLPTMPISDWYIAGGPPSSATATRYVMVSGSDSNPGTFELPFSTIQHAGNVAPSGGIIRVGSGNYPAGANLRGQNVRLRVIDGTVNIRQ